MKKKLFTILTALTCMMAAITAIPSSAESVDTDYTITSEHFVYTDKCIDVATDNHAFHFESDLVSPDVLIVGTLDQIYEDGSLTRHYAGKRLNIDGIVVADVYLSKVDFGDFGEQELQVGDLLKCTSDRMPVGEKIPPFFAANFEYLGNGMDIFGEDFKHVIRREMPYMERYGCYDISILESRWGDKYKFVKGDVTLDDSLNILDCIQINKAMLAGEPLCDYAKLTGDVNENGILDMDDSLCILKETIGITENFK
ncbi:MAG: hypothetical protein E7502_06360 [Ruminococcus sp.]|nr:hypothetical protein [Ruminococcus sp.]